MSFSAASAIVLAFTIGFYSAAPFAFHALHVSPVDNSLFYIVYAGSLIVGAITNSRITTAPVRTFRYCLVAYTIVFVVGYSTRIVDRSLFFVLVFVIATGFICGIAAALTLSLSMSGVETARGAASGLQGAIKMSFAGICLFLFDQTTINKFSTIAMIFLILTAGLFVFYVLGNLSPNLKSSA